MTCDDSCQLDMDLTPNSNANVTSLLSLSSYDSYKSFFYDNKRLASEKVTGWLNLTKDEPYFLSTKHINKWG